MSPLLDIRNLTIDFTAHQGNAVQAVTELSVPVYTGATLGIVGESGSGKSTTALSILGLLPQASVSGQLIWENDTDLLKLSPATLQKIRGRQISMIFQEPMTALNPVLRCGFQLEENIRLYYACSRLEAREQALHWLEKVRIPEPNRILHAYPHEISGGQKQRVMIAMAMAGRPKLLIADEPTTALDVSIQKTIIELLLSLREELDMSMLFISHDLGLIGEIADQIAVLRNGRLEEYGATGDILQNPQSPYTHGLLSCRPSLIQRYSRLPTLETPDPGQTALAHKALPDGQNPLLQVREVSVQYTRQTFLGGAPPRHTALEQVSFDLFPGETLGIVGESGSGKTTLGKVIARILAPKQGSIQFEGSPLQKAGREIQMIYQDPYASLNPMMQVGEALLEALRIARPTATRQEAIRLLETVGLQADHYHRRPHEFSGGQRQRISIARAMAVSPRILICDEITSALDVSIQATILNLLLDLQEQLKISYLFISHDLSVIRQMSDRILVLKDGQVDAYGTPDQVLDEQPTEYVRMLLDAVPGRG